jgi:hypothetical protein
MRCDGVEDRRCWPVHERMSHKVDRKHRRQREQPGSCRQIPDSRMESGSEPKVRLPPYACSPANLHFFLEPSRLSSGPSSLAIPLPLLAFGTCIKSICVSGPESGPLGWVLTLLNPK